MTKEQLINYIKVKYKVVPDTPFPRDFESLVFRHKDNNKWFALVMGVGKDKLGLSSQDMVDIVNVKVEPELAYSIVGHGGIYPGYHMNKQHWITLLLDGTTSDDNIKSLIDMSYTLTEKKQKPKKRT